MKDLRSFIAELDAGGLLVRIGKPADAATQVANLAHDLQRRGVAGLFLRVNGHQRLIANVVGTRAALELALATGGGDPVRTFRERARERVEPVEVDAAPSQEVVVLGDDVDIAELLPIVTHSAKDAGPYLTSGMVLAHDPDTGIRNVSVNRMPLRGPREVGVRMMAPQHLGVIYDKWEARQEPLPVVVAIGLHPADYIAAATTIPYGEDELELAGALRREPFPLVPAKTVPLMAPAHAEIVLEGHITVGDRVPDGPFGEFLRTYTMTPSVSNRFVISAVTHRADSIYQMMAAGSREDVHLLGVGRAAELLRALEVADNDIVAVALTPTILGAVVSMRQRYDGEAKSVALTCLGVYRWLKYCIVVDDDIDVDDHEQVMWAITTRTNAARDFVVVPGTNNFPLEFDAAGIHSSKLVVDATFPSAERPEFERTLPPGERQLRVEDFLD